MKTITINTQEELDALPKDIEAIIEITGKIDKIDKVYPKAFINIIGNAEVNSIENTNIERICDNVRINTICGDTNIEYISDNVVIKRICDNVKIGFIYNNTKINNVHGNTSIDYISGNSMIIYLHDYAKVKTVTDFATISYVFDHAKIYKLLGSSTIGTISDYATIYNILGNAVVHIAAGNSTIQNLCFRSTINCAKDNTTIEHVFDNAIVKVFSSDVVVESVGGNAIVSCYDCKPKIWRTANNAKVVNVEAVRHTVEEFATIYGIRDGYMYLYKCVREDNTDFCDWCIKKFEGIVTCSGWRRTKPFQSNTWPDRRPLTLVGCINGNGIILYPTPEIAREQAPAEFVKCLKCKVDINDIAVDDSGFKSYLEVRCRKVEIVGEV